MNNRKETHLRVDIIEDKNKGVQLLGKRTLQRKWKISKFRMIFYFDLNIEVIFM